jgi:SAM-dependent MidA family methyltransferase
MPNAECRMPRHWAFGIDMSELTDLLLDRIRRRGPVTAAEFMDTALYHAQRGYYNRAGRRSGRGGDFFTSVDVGPLFGELLAVQIAECLDLLASGLRPPASEEQAPRTRHQAPLDLIEAGAGNGRLARDVLDAVAAERPELYDLVRVRLVERSEAARAQQVETLGPHAARLAARDAALQEGVTGVVYANELLDAMPVHVVVMRGDELREIYVGERDGSLVEIEGAPSTPALQAYLNRAGVTLAPNGRAEINLAAEDWMAAAGRAIARGFLILVDYGHEAAELFSGSHAAGTLMTFARHRAGSSGADWLREPGARDITSHVDLTSVRAAAERAGFTALGITDQTYFLLGLGLTNRIGSGVASAFSRTNINRINQAKTLMMPGGLGSTHKVMIFGKAVGQPRLKGLSYRERVT